MSELSTSAAKTGGPRAALRHPDFRRYVASSFLSNLGTQMLGVAVGWQIYDVTHRALDLGFVGLAQFLPAFTLSLPAGNVADRVDRGRIVAASNLALAVCAALLLLLATRGGASVWPVYVVLVFVGVATAFDAPAGQALVPGLVPKETLANAVTWTSTTWQVSTIVGPPLGGLLYGVAKSATLVYGVCGAAFTLSSLFAFLIAKHPREGAPEPVSWGTALAGLRFVRASPVILASVSLDLFAVLLGGATALLPIFARDILYVGPRGLGALRSAPAVGAAAMAGLLAYRPLRRRAGPVLLASVALFGAATVVFGLSRSVVLSLFALAVLGASDMVSVVVRSTVVQLRTPHAMRGRVSAVSMLFVATSSNLGELESGVTAAWLGAKTAVVLGGIATVVVVAAFALGSRTLRAVDRLSD